MQESADQKQPRWFLLGIAAVLLFGGSVWNWKFRDVPRQAQVVTMAQLVLGYLLLVLLWILFFSALQRRTRALIFAGTVLGVGLLFANFRITGVSGDLVPIVSWRWKKSVPTAVPPASQAPPTVELVRLPGDYPQYLGPDRNGIISNAPLAAWNTKLPALIWKKQVGPAWSGFAVSGQVAVTQEQQGEEEVLAAYHLSSGKPLWKSGITAHYKTTIAGEGPRSTPTIQGNRVYALGATGWLRCHDLTNGLQLWITNLAGGQKLPDWGVSASPLVHQGRVIVSVAGPDDQSIRVFDAATGAGIWSAGCDSANYSSPVLIRLLGEEQVIGFHAKLICAHSFQDGTFRWSYPWPPTHPHVTMPFAISTNRLLFSSGYGTGTELLEVSHASGEWKATRVWKSNRLKSKFSNLVVRDNFIYGLDDGMMACLDLATGDLKWKDGRFGHGQLILVGKFLLLMAETGEVLQIDPVPSGLKVIARLKALKGKTWNPPALAGNFLVVRNDHEAACLELPLTR